MMLSKLVNFNGFYTYRITMEQNYNDYKLLTPDQMEYISKKYYEKLNDNSKLKDILIYKKIGKVLSDLMNYYETLKYVCSSKFYKLNVSMIDENLSTISKMYDRYSIDKVKIKRLYNVSFFDILILIIKNLLKIIEIFLFELKSYDDAKNLFFLITQTINFI